MKPTAALIGTHRVREVFERAIGPQMAEGKAFGCRESSPH
jgi:hypothetical protein